MWWVLSRSASASYEYHSIYFLFSPRNRKVSVFEKTKTKKTNLSGALLQSKTPFQPLFSELDSSNFEFWHDHCSKQGCQHKFKNRMANSADPDGTARHEPSHLDLHYLQRFLFWSGGAEKVIKGTF